MGVSSNGHVVKGEGTGECECEGRDEDDVPTLRTKCRKVANPLLVLSCAMPILNVSIRPKASSIALHVREKVT